MAHYYLIASLPAFGFGEPPPLGLADFLERCRAQLPEAELRQVEAVLSGNTGPVDHSFARAWHGFEVHLRNTIARVRAAARGVDAAPHLRDGEAWEGAVLEGVEDAYARPHPLEREMELDHLRWGKLDELGVGHAFDLQAVFIYGLRLQLALRRQAWNVSAGRNKLQEFMQLGGKTS